jgi:nicotinamide-nucleotide amidase
VDPDVALALAAGARERCGADWGLATTGVAGPEPQDGIPVGLVYVAVAGPTGAAVRELQLVGNRAEVRIKSVTAVLNLLVERLRTAPAPA